MNVSDNLSKLKSLGYNQFFEDASSQLGVDIETLARVVAEHKGVYEVIGAEGESRASVSGKRMQTARGRDDYPAVGDWVIVKEGPHDIKQVEDILQRKTTLRKKYSNKNEAQLMVANVDVVFIVESLNRDYSINRFERYLVLAQEGGVKPVIVLNKTDLMSQAELTSKVEELHDQFPDVEVLQSSVVATSGLKSISDYIQPGTTHCFLGSSGVGKSSIINSLVDRAVETKAIGATSGRGVHTTTSRQMYFTSEGGIIIDNPGSREVGVVDFGANAREVFADIESLSKSCSFKNCGHTSEQGCAVMYAIQSGDIKKDHYENYLKLRNETEQVASSSQKNRLHNKRSANYSKKVNNELQRLDDQDIRDL